LEQGATARGRSLGNTSRRSKACVGFRIRVCNACASTSRKPVANAPDHGHRTEIDGASSLFRLGTSSCDAFLELPPTTFFCANFCVRLSTPMSFQPKTNLRGWLLLGVWATLIAVLSRDSFSAAASARLLSWLETFLPAAPNLEPLNVVFRKSLHVFLYGTLGAIAYSAFRHLLGPRRYALTALLAVVLCGTVASADELHQTLLAHRTGRARDVLLDVTAGLAASLAAIWVTRKARKTWDVGARTLDPWRSAGPR